MRRVLSLSAFLAVTARGIPSTRHAAPPKRRSGWPVPLSIAALVRFFAAALLMSIGVQGFAATRVLFEIDMRDEIRAGRFDPTKDRVGVRGGGAPLSWDTPVLAKRARETTDVRDSEDDRDSLWIAELTVERAPIGGALPYKFRIERHGQASDAGWEPGQNRMLELVADRVRVARVFGAPAAPISLSRAGRIEALPPIPTRFVSPRTLQVWLPPGYENEPQRRYPVLYLQDGQNVFDAAAAGAEWSVDETAQRLVVSGAIQPLIIVAVSNSPQRADDYTATRIVVDGAAQGGNAAAYARHLIEEIKPAIDARYRTLKDATHTAVGGSSLGGNLSLWLAMHHNEVFGAALVVSPALWWDDEFPIRDVARTPLPMSLARPRLWIDMGDGEGERAIRQLRKLRQQLFNRGWDRSTLNYQEAPGATHDEASWAARVEGMLRFLDRQAWPAAGPTAPSVGQDPFPPSRAVDINRPPPRP
ncbi:alpha/beta hydrolase [Roseateles amylovorans]|uniref:Alpha/beta hydrolase-fold protein n=1 Tax=Roseateles amylovorans TaxID=2978473 RepID=A0ABY6B2C2_9BURK|nr:alpha/beta hydrolase-fold protein [Roseateles amylovorans]UXH79548.1 alpha/beta hydrolase-fold protein [Roseateles amylovorans]